MNKRLKEIFVLLLTISIISGCADRSNNHSSYQYPPSSSQTNRQPNDDQIPDASGFSIKELETALRKVGAINEKGEHYDVAGTYFESAVRYGNIVIAESGINSISQAISDYNKGSMELHGNKVKVANMIGGYLLIVLEGDISQEAIKAFQAVGGL